MLLIRNKKYLIKNQGLGRVCEAPPRRGRGKGFSEKPKVGIGAGTGMGTEMGTEIETDLFPSLHPIHYFDPWLSLCQIIGYC